MILEEQLEIYSCNYSKKNLSIHFRFHRSEQIPWALFSAGSIFKLRKFCRHLQTRAFRNKLWKSQLYYCLNERVSFLKIIAWIFEIQTKRLSLSTVFLPILYWIFESETVHQIQLRWSLCKRMFVFGCVLFTTLSLLGKPTKTLNSWYWNP